MDEKNYKDKTDVLLQAIMGNMRVKMDVAYNCGALNISKYSDATYELPHIVVIAALQSIAATMKQNSFKEMLTDINNLRHFI